jgi:DNA topoisomerase 2-associated protein PAT1
MEELERQMLQNMVIGRTPTETQPLVSPAPPSQPSPLQPPQAATTGQPPVRQPPMSVQGGFPPQHLPQQATFPMQSPGNAMFPPLGAQPPAMAQHGQQQQGHAIPSEQVSMDLERKIMETEMAEAKRRRKAAKIASMAKYNDIMTGGE